MAEIRRDTLSVYWDTRLAIVQAALAGRVDGQLVVSPQMHARFRDAAAGEIAAIARGPILAIPVVEVPDDGQWHEIGAEKLASVALGGRIVVRQSDTNSARKVAE